MIAQGRPPPCRPTRQKTIKRLKIVHRLNRRDDPRRINDPRAMILEAVRSSARLRPWCSSTGRFAPRT